MRVVVVHAKSELLDLSDPDAAAHAFGPFDSIEAALAFDALAPDGCVKAAFVLAGPDPGDIDLWIAEDAR